jgi:Xaa-Pro aminopeptidase
VGRLSPQKSRSSNIRPIVSARPPLSMISISTNTDETVTQARVAGEKLNRLRDLMNTVGVDAYVIPTEDPHLSEYVPSAYSRREFISGFQGSAGTALVTSTGAWLWTDGRYYNEATLQLDPNYWYEIALYGMSHL